MIYVIIYALIGILVGIKMFLISLRNLVSEGRNFENSAQEIKNDFLLLVISSLILWPLYLLIASGFYVWKKFSKLLLRFCERKFEKQKIKLDKDKFVKQDLFDGP